MADISRDAGLQADEPAVQSAAKLFGFLWQEAWTHAHATLEGDADALHDMRVALRRLRSSLQNFEGARLDPPLGKRLRRELRDQRGALGKLGDALGGVRDYDVLDDYLQDYAKTHGHHIAEMPGLSAFETHLQHEREQGFTLMTRRIMRADATGGLREEFARWALGLSVAVTPPLLLRGAAQKVLPARLDEVAALSHVLDDPREHEQHHELRKALRRTRYTLETFSVVFGKIKEPVKTLTRMQDALGEMQDRAVLRLEAIRAFDLHPKHPERGADPDVAAFLEHGEARSHLLLEEARAMMQQAMEGGFFEGLRGR